MLSHLSHHLKHLRTRSQLSLRDVASHIGVGHATVHGWETGAIRLYADNLEHFLAAVNATPEQREEAWRLAGERPGTAPHLAAEEAPAGPAP